MRESAHAELVALAGPAWETLGARSSRCCARIYIVQLKSSYSVDYWPIASKKKSDSDISPCRMVGPVASGVLGNRRGVSISGVSTFQT